jgi:UDP-N-acetylmuramoyl-tripeptide--D-alanyl-D-alanine ligase
MKFNIAELVEATEAEVLKNELKPEEMVEISTDTRTIKNGEIYLPLKGESFDGEKFLKTAVDSGSEGYFTTGNEIIEGAKVVLKVLDTKTAYLQIAGFARDKFNPKVVDITGSSGKTTTKEMTYSVLSEKFKTHKTAKNFNNEVGFCKTILSMPEDTEVLILEMGMRGFGEIALLSKYSKPDIAVIANIGTAHIGRLGSRENIANAKCEIIKYLKQNGTLIAHRDSLLQKVVSFRTKPTREMGLALNFPKWSRGENFEKIYFSLNDVQILERKVGYTKFIYKDEEFELNVEGDYNVQDSLAAINTGLKLGMSFDEIRSGLRKYSPIEKRWETEKINGFNVINDSYNANPDSVKAAVETFVELYSANNAKLLVVLGDMGELGENEVKYHEEVGEFLAEKMKISDNIKLITVGALAEKLAQKVSNSGFFTKSFADNQSAGHYILENIEVGTTIFLKASRSMKLEEIIEIIKKKEK